MTAMQAEADETDRDRLAMLDNVIAEHILIPPKFACYPDVELVLWRTVQSAIIGRLPVDAALSHMREQIREIVNGDGNVRAATNGRFGTTIPHGVS